MADTSKSDVLREWIDKKLDDKYNYMLDSKVKQDFEDFCKTHPQSICSYQLHGKIIDERLVARGLDPRTYGRKKRKKRLPSANTDLSSDITPEPVPETSTDPNKPNQPKIKSSTTGDSTIPEITQDEFNEVFTDESTGEFFGGFWLMSRAFAPKMPTLDEARKQSIGKMARPIFNKYFRGNSAVLIIAATILTMYLGDIAKARNAQKKEDETKKAEQEEHGRSNKLSCKYCKEEFSSSELPVHERKCPKK